MPGLHPGRLAWLPIPVLLVAMAVLWIADPPGSHESLYVLTALNFVLSTLVSLFVAYLIARSFLVRAAPGSLLLGCGVVIWGSALAAGVGVGLLGADRGHLANVAVTIHNLCVWLSALCHLAGVIVPRWTHRVLSAAGLWLGAGYTMALAAVGVVVFVTLERWTPIFFMQGQGGTPLRYVVLGSAVVMFALTAVLLRESKRPLLFPFVHWYMLALGLIAVGLLGVMFQSSSGGILGWVGRGTQFLGGVYLLLAAVASVRESHVWGISLEAALRESEERYRTLFETAPDAIVVCRGDRFLLANDMALRLTGAASFVQLADHTVPDFFGPQERQRVIERMSLAEAGRRLPVREAALLRLDGREVMVEFHTAPVDFQGAPAVQTVIHDITERRRGEASLRELNATLESKVTQRTAQLERRTEQLQKLMLELSQVQERERKHVARVLHEDLQQQIAGAKFQLSLLSGQARDDESRETTTAEINQILKDAIGTSRRLSHELSPAVCYGNDLAEAITWLVDQMATRQGLRVQVNGCGNATLESELLAAFLFRAAREMLSNVAQHAGVREAAVRLRRMGRYVGLCVSDQGRGFDLLDLKENAGFGLLGIRERVELLGGRTRIESVRGRGTRVRIVVPDARENGEIARQRGDPQP